jgi:hypothetical protein
MYRMQRKIDSSLVSKVNKTNHMLLRTKSNWSYHSPSGNVSSVTALEHN